MMAGVSGCASARPSHHLILAGEDCKQHLPGYDDVLEEATLVIGMAGGCHAGSPAKTMPLASFSQFHVAGVRPEVSFPSGLPQQHPRLCWCSDVVKLSVYFTRHWSKQPINLL